MLPSSGAAYSYSPDVVNSFNPIGKLPILALALFTPTLILSSLAFVDSLHKSRNFKIAFSGAIQAATECNVYSLSRLAIRSFIGPKDFLHNNRQGLFFTSVLLHLLSSATFSFFALSSNSLYAIPAILIALPLFNRSYIDFLRSTSDSLASYIPYY